jgi:Protein of unknown function (DUF3179)
MVDGRTLHFRLAGINNQNFIMQDEETGSWWQQVTGEAIFGPLKGRRLKAVFHDELSFDLWSRERPGGRVLRPGADPAWKKFSEDWETSTGKLPVVTPAKPDSALPPRALVVGVSVEGITKAYPFSAIEAQSPLLDVVGAVPLILVLGDDRRSVRAFDRRVDGRVLELVVKVHSSPLRMTDLETGSEWDFGGEAVAGPLAGKRLAPIFILKDYWFDWVTYNPDTRVYLRGLR